MTARLPRGDAGVTLIELVVGMALMAVFMTMFTGAVVLMTSTASKVDSVSQSANQVNQAFLKLDRLVRYAAAISTPGQATAPGSSGDWYVELRTTNTGTEACTQLRVDTTSQQLQERTWTVDRFNVPTAASAWLPMASAITNGPADQPFTLPATGANIYQQLQITLVSTPTSTHATTTRSAMTFTALNSVVNPTPPICQHWGRP